jgi:hypothetical protein
LKDIQINVSNLNGGIVIPAQVGISQGLTSANKLCTAYIINEHDNL